LTRLLLPAILLALLVFAAPLHADLAEELLPTYSELYDDLKLASTRGLVPAELLNTRPLTRGQIAEVLASGLRDNRESLLSDPVGLRLVNEFAEELEALGSRVPKSRHASFWRRQVTLESNGPVLMDIVPYAWVRVDNVEPVYFTALADRRIGYRGSFSIAGGALLLHHDLVAGNHSDEPRGIPDFGTLNALVEGEDMNTWVHRGYIRLDTDILEVFFGRDWIRWGPGRTGTLGMGDAAPALNHLLLKKRTGKFDFTSFVSTLDFDNDEMLAGHRMELALPRGFNLGVAEQVRFRTLGQGPLYLLSVVPYSLLEKVVKEDSSADEVWRNNVMWSLDVDWTPARGTRLYGEFLIDDLSFSSDKKPTQIGYQFGLVRSGFGTLKNLTLEAEITKIHRYTFTQARRSSASDTLGLGSRLDFVRSGDSLGHPIGPDSESYYFAARYDASASSKWEFSLEIRRSGELDLGDAWTVGDPIPSTSSLSGIVETSSRAMLSYTFTPDWWSGSWATVGGGFRKSTNFRNAEGEDKDWDGIMQASLMVSW
jgi:hypothetical protein